MSMKGDIINRHKSFKGMNELITKYGQKQRRFFVLMKLIMTEEIDEINGEMYCD